MNRSRCTTPIPTELLVWGHGVVEPLVQLRAVLEVLFFTQSTIVLVGHVSIEQTQQEKSSQAV